MLSQRNQSQRRSKLQERRAADQYGGSVSPGSGNGWIRKADVRTPNYLIECKTTTKESYSIKKETWETLNKQAIVDGRIPVMIVDINGKTLMIADPEDFMVTN